MLKKGALEALTQKSKVSLKQFGKGPYSHKRYPALSFLIEFPNERVSQISFTLRLSPMTSARDRLVLYAWNHIEYLKNSPSYHTDTLGRSYIGKKTVDWN